MSVKKYGIYLSYAPGLDLRNEGLGRYLAAFLKGASGRTDVRFVIMCPSWSQQGLKDLFKSENLPVDSFDILAPASSPLILRLYEWLNNRKKNRDKLGLLDRALKKTMKIGIMARSYWEQKIIHVHTFMQAALAGIEALLWFAIAVPFMLAASPLLVLGIVGLVLHRIVLRMRLIFAPIYRRINKLRGALGAPKDDNFVLRLYASMEATESNRMMDLIEEQLDIRAWYCPTAFWPAFNRIKGPKLVCVPDLVINDYPIGFSNIGGDRILENFRKINDTIRGGRYFVTYSKHVKNETLVQRFSVPAIDVEVIPHAPNTLNQWIDVTGFADCKAASTHYAKVLLHAALHAQKHAYTSGFSNTDFKFIFYASQFRPNKNVLTLLKAYRQLLRERFLPHKLLLTGAVAGYPEVANYISKHRLQGDVICMHGLSVQALSACYKLADIAVNPSMSEGGCPFTFTEALSVDTPALMARIPVAEEVLTDPELRKVTLFDPLDAKELARRIEWSVQNRDQLLRIQKTAYDRMIGRTWADVAEEHIRVLESISRNEAYHEQV